MQRNKAARLGVTVNAVADFDHSRFDFSYSLIQGFVFVDSINYSAR
jgi:hypothetical protein